MEAGNSSDEEFLEQALRTVTAHTDYHKTFVTPELHRILAAEDSMPDHLPQDGIGLRALAGHLTDELVLGFNGSSLSPHYYGFVTGGTTPAARWADNVATLYDQNVQVHLPKETVATRVEDRALTMLMELLRFKPEEWPARTLTTGATASNILGLACGREHVMQVRSRSRSGEGSYIPGEASFLEGCRLAGIADWQVLATMGHSSLAKAASIVGLGRLSVIDVGREEEPLEFDMLRLEKHLSSNARGSIVVVSCGEVNTGGFATHSREEVQQIRLLCDTYGAWLHVDGAFGIFARTLQDCGPDFERVANGARWLEVADSITGDAHKLLNVPYDCGFFFCKSKLLAKQTFRNNAAYLSPSGGGGGIESPLNIGIENSRRFRGLPVYATLLAYGRSGYTEMLQRQISLAREIARFINGHECFELLSGKRQSSDAMDDVFVIVLFRSKDHEFNKRLTQEINSTGKIYVSGTSWHGLPACRIAIANYSVNVERDLKCVREVLTQISRSTILGQEG